MAQKGCFANDDDYLFIYCLFNDAIGISDCMASNDSMIN
jgi:hypothetical protein